MPASVVTRRPVRQPARPPRRRRVRPRPAAPPPRPLDLDRAADDWQRVLDAADRALHAAPASLAAGEVAPRLRALARERASTAELLQRVARETGFPYAPWLAPAPVTPAMLGLPQGTRACVFVLEGVLTDSAVLHAAAWAEVLDAFLHRLAERTGWHGPPFDPETDYRTYIEGRPRLEGVHGFLASRGIRLPEGGPDDPPGRDTARGLARRKGDALERLLRRRAPVALPGARRYLDAAGRAGIGRGVVSASATTREMLEVAGLASLVDARVDAAAIRREALRSPPAPDVLLSACRALGVRPGEAVAFTRAELGAASARAAGIRLAPADGPLDRLLDRRLT